jgi:hypothetical protein
MLSRRSSQVTNRKSKLPANEQDPRLGKGWISYVLYPALVFDLTFLRLVE